MLEKNIQIRGIGMVVLLGISVPGMGGCGSGVSKGSPSFTPGSGSTFGTVANPSTGREFVIETVQSGKPSRVFTNDGGSFSFDEQGNLSQVVTADGSTLDLQRNEDGSLDVTIRDISFGEVSFTMETGKFQFLAKSQSLRFQPVSSTLCLLLTAICLNLEELLPELKDTAVAVGASLVAPQLVGPGPLGFSTVGEAEAFFRDQISNEFSKYADQIEDFCSSWRALILAEVNPCS